MVPVLAVTSAECVAALALAGFRHVRRPNGERVFVRDLRQVTIPPDVEGVLEPRQLEGILKAAGIPYSEFLELLSRAFAPEPEPRASTAESGIRVRVSRRETG